jgi:hypothetical protein
MSAIVIGNFTGNLYLVSTILMDKDHIHIDLSIPLQVALLEELR